MIYVICGWFEEFGIFGFVVFVLVCGGGIVFVGVNLILLCMDLWMFFVGEWYLFLIWVEFVLVFWVCRILFRIFFNECMLVVIGLVE